MSSPQSVVTPVWRALSCADQPRSILDLHNSTSAPRSSIHRCLKKWERRGLVIGVGNPRVYRMSDTGAAATQPPVLRQPVGSAGGPPNARQRCWSAMGVLRRFDLPTLEMAASVSRAAAQSYVRSLVHAGYIRVLSKGYSRAGEYATYQLIKRTGPKAPGITHFVDASGRRVREVVDRNDGTRSPGSKAGGAREVNHVG